MQAKRARQRWGSVWAGDFSLSLSLSLSRCSHFLHAFGLNLKGFFTHFIVVSFRFIVDFAHFIVISSHLVVNFSYFIVGFSRIFVAFSHLFTCKRHFLGHYAFLKFLNALFLGFLCLSLLAVFVKTAWQSINLALFLLFGLPRSLCSLAMTARLAALVLWFAYNDELRVKIAVVATICFFMACHACKARKGKIMRFSQKAKSKHFLKKFALKSDLSAFKAARNAQKFSRSF